MPDQRQDNVPGNYIHGHFLCNDPPSYFNWNKLGQIPRGSSFQFLQKLNTPPFDHQFSNNLGGHLWDPHYIPVHFGRSFWLNLSARGSPSAWNDGLNKIGTITWSYLRYELLQSLSTSLVETLWQCRKSSKSLRTLFSCSLPDYKHFKAILQFLFDNN